jgi:two-component system sensor histidine kinase TctE
MTKPLRPSLRRRLLVHLWVPLLVVLTLGAVGGIGIARHVGYLVHDQWLLDSAMTLAAQVTFKDGRARLDLPQSAIDMFEWDRIDHIYWQASSARAGRLLGNAAIPPPPRAPAADEPEYTDSIIDGNAVRIVSWTRSGPAGVDDTVLIQVGETMHKREGVARQIFVRWTPLQLGVLVLAGAFIWLAVTRNLSKVDSIAARLASYETDSLVPIADAESTPREIAPLVTAMNRLILKLRHEHDAQKRFISNAAHQLRTPLATLQVQTQRVMREHDPVRHDLALGDVHQAVSRLHHVTHQLLTLMRSEEQTEQHLRLAEMDLAALAREEVERWTDAALERLIDLGYEGPERGVLIHGEMHLLRELIGNLIDNAIRYNVDGGRVTLILATAPVRLAVVDDGPGIPADERGLVVERFYRGRTSDHVGGCGLGLPIVLEIAARHGAELTITEGAGGLGAHIAVTFPAARASSR